MSQKWSIECVLLLSGVAVMLGSLFFQTMLWFNTPLLRSVTSHSRNQSVLNFTRKYCGWAINIKQACPESCMPNLHIANRLRLKLGKNGAKNKIRLFPPHEISDVSNFSFSFSVFPWWKKATSEGRSELCVPGQWLTVVEEGIPSI